MASDYKNQHYVPQTYLQAWCDTDGKVTVYDCKTGELYRNSKPKKVLYDFDLYTKGCDCPLVLSEDDKKQVFGVLENLTIQYQDNVLMTFEDFAMYYSTFEEWTITNPDGSPVNKRKLKDLIDGVRLIELEKGWQPVEDPWGEIRSHIVNYVETGVPLPDNTKELLSTYLVTQKYRTLKSLQAYQTLIKDMFDKFNWKDIMGDYYEKEVSELAEALFLGQIDKFQQGDNSAAYLKEIAIYRDNTHFRFWKACGSRFFTSDSPVFQVTNNIRLDPTKYNDLYIPITPTIMLGVYKGDTSSFSIEHMGSNNIRRFNQEIVNSALNYFIKPGN